eukprot:9320160-Pyramimonas_sp.AAC.1
MSCLSPRTSSAKAQHDHGLVEVQTESMFGAVYKYKLSQYHRLESQLRGRRRHKGSEVIHEGSAGVRLPLVNLRAKMV